jgi:hypothetical protein
LADDGDSHIGGQIGELIMGIVALGVPGILLILILVSAGGLLAGFAIWSIIGLISKWFVPLIFLIAGAVSLYELAGRGTRLALVGVGIFLLFIVVGVLLYYGAFNGPANSYNLLLSLAPNQSPAPIEPSTSPYVWGGILIGVGLSGYGVHKLHHQLEE